MKFWQRLKDARPVLGIRQNRRPAHQPRRTRLEALEPRTVLSASIAPLADVTLLGGAPLNVAVHATDPDHEILRYEVSSSNPGVTPTLWAASSSPSLQSLRLSVNYTGNPNDPTDDFSGDMVFGLFEQYCPKVTSRIEGLVSYGGESGMPFYDGLTFHKIVPNSMIQGGDPNGNGTGGSGITLDDEFTPELQFTSSGLLAMANHGSDTNDSQFFITSGPYRSGDFRSTIVGFLISGDDVRQKIAAVPVDSHNNPLYQVQISHASVEIDETDSVLHLSAPAGTTGTSTITVKAINVATDTGLTEVVASQDFDVTIQSDTYNDPPYLDPTAPLLDADANPMPTIETGAGAPVTFKINAHDAEGDAIYYSATVDPPTLGVSVTVDPSTGVGVFTPAHGVKGDFNLILHVGASSSSSGSALDNQAIPVHVQAASGNVSPVLAPASPSLGTTPGGTPKTIGLSNFINHGAGTTAITDADTGALVGGIALTGATGRGTWAYSFDGTTFEPVGAVANGSALLLPNTAQLRYAPSGLNGETATIAYRAWDITSGTAGAKVDTAVGGAGSAFSSAVDVASLVVTKMQSPVIRLPGGGGSNAAVLFRRGDRLQMLDSRGKVVFNQPLASLWSLSIQGIVDKADKVTVDFARGGAFTLPGGITFDGKRGTADALLLRGTAGADVFKVGNRSATIGSLVVRFSGVEQLSLDGGAGNDTYQVSTLSTKTLITDSKGTDSLDFSQATQRATVDLRKNAGQPQRIFASNQNTLALKGVIETLIRRKATDWIMANAAASQNDDGGKEIL